MKQFIRFILIFCACMTAIDAGSAKTKAKVKSVSGTAEYVVTDDMSITLRDARLKCVELARAEAIRREFGELVSMGIIDVFMNSTNEGSGAVNIGTASSQARALWLGDTREPKVNIRYADGKLFFKAEVWGEARELKINSTDLKWMISHKAGEQKVETSSFNNSESIYIDFKSVADGYVAVYLVEDNEQTWCLLPYGNDSDGRQEVKAGRRYAFFDKEFDKRALTIRLKTKRKEEYNQLVLIYSPNPFTKSIDRVADGSKANVLSTRDFAKWLLKCQCNDPDMVVEQRFIKIKNNAVGY